jgi:hypothetical protein
LQETFLERVASFVALIRDNDLQLITENLTVSELAGSHTQMSEIESDFHTHATYQRNDIKKRKKEKKEKKERSLRLSLSLLQVGVCA